MAEVTFPEGISVKDPHESAPDFVQGRISMKKDELIPWLQKQEGEWVNCDIKRSKGGKLYLQVDNWKPNASKTTTEAEEPKDILPF
ncbi:MAG TPA: hypothetical protein EYQ69_03645 [Gemmatimonadetes bacterium]|jgi:hypothetical protein|nr:hypothetical protein [Gemmatimonadota bacterium]